MTILDAKLLRSARGLAGWTQEQLAQNANVAVTTIRQFEAGASENLTPGTNTKIMRAFDRAGYDIRSDGPRRRQVKNYILTGDDANYRLLDDIYYTLKGSGGEVLIAGLSEVDDSQPEALAFLKSHLERLQNAGITERILIEKGDTNFVAPLEWYRWFPDSGFSAAPFQLFGNKIAMIDWGPPLQVIVIEHAGYAESFRVMFNALWKMAEPVKPGGDD